MVGNPGHPVRVEGKPVEGPDTDWIHLPDPIAEAIKELSDRIAELERAARRGARRGGRRRRRHRAAPQEGPLLGRRLRLRALASASTTGRSRCARRPARRCCSRRLPVARSPPAAATTTTAARTRHEITRGDRARRDQRRPGGLHRARRRQSFTEQTRDGRDRRGGCCKQCERGRRRHTGRRGRGRPTSRSTATPPPPRSPSPAASSTARRSTSPWSRRATSGSSTSWSAFSEFDAEAFAAQLPQGTRRARRAPHPEAVDCVTQQVVAQSDQAVQDVRPWSGPAGRGRDLPALREVLPGRRVVWRPVCSCCCSCWF